MQKLLELSKKDTRYVIGIMSGTSLDGVDAALVKITGSSTNTQLDLVGYIEYPFPKGYKELALKNSTRESSNVEDICRLNSLIPHVYYDAIQRLLQVAKFDIEEIDLIGIHGQTIHHLPTQEEIFGYKLGSTLQIGSSSVLAKLSGVPVVGNFRMADIALGGQGAPLVPYFDYIMFSSTKKSRALLNIGGISNFTILAKNCNPDNVIAFDTGPGNMMMDITTKRLMNVEFDENGKTAEEGKLNESFFNDLIAKDDYIEKAPPKSTGRELYGEEFLNEFFIKYKDIPVEDFLHTLSKFTAYGIYRSYKKFIFNETRIDELIVSGGGARNLFLLKCLSGYFGETVEVKVIDELGFSSDAKEAICFAVLANETISGNTSNIPRTTGASKSTILGEIALP